MEQFITQILVENESQLSPMELKAIRKRLEEAGLTQEALECEVEAQVGAYNQNLVVQTSETAYKDLVKRLAKEAGVELPEEPNHVQARAEIYGNCRRTTYGYIITALRWTWDKLRHLMDEVAHFEQHLKDKERIIVSQQETIESKSQSIERQENLVARLRIRNEVLEGEVEKLTKKVYALEHPEEAPMEPREVALARSLPDSALRREVKPLLGQVEETDGFLRILHLIKKRTGWKDEYITTEAFLRPFLDYLPDSKRVSKNIGQIQRRYKEFTPAEEE